MLAEAEAFCFADEATYEWRNHASGSVVRNSGAMNEAMVIRSGLATAARNGFSERSDAPEDNRGMFGFAESK